MPAPGMSRPTTIAVETYALGARDQRYDYPNEFKRGVLANN